MINSWGFTLTYHKKRGFRHRSGHGSGKRGGGGVFTEEHTCAGNIWGVSFLQLKYLLNNQFFIYGSNYENIYIYFIFEGFLGPLN